MSEKQKLFPRSKVAKPGDFGFCPVCGCHGRTRQRRPNGNDTCVNGHEYPSAHSREEPPGTTATALYREAIESSYPDPVAVLDKMERWADRPKDEKMQVPYGYCPTCLAPGVKGAKPGSGSFKTIRFHCGFGHGFSYETVLTRSEVLVKLKEREDRLNNGLVPPAIPGAQAKTVTTRTKTWQLRRGDVEAILKFHLGIGEDCSVEFDYTMTYDDQQPETVVVIATKQVNKEGVDFND